MTRARPDRRRPDPALQEVAGRAEGVAVIYPDTGRGAAHQLIPNMQQLTLSSYGVNEISRYSSKYKTNLILPVKSVHLSFSVFTLDI